MQRASLRSRQSVGSNVGSEMPAYALNLIVHVYIAKLMEYKYGIHGEKGYAKSMDGGERWMLTAADGQPVCTWDSRGHKLHTEYDELRRPTRQWLNEDTLAGETVYGTDAANNLIGQPWKIHDQSGMIENTRYDFKGNLLESRRKFTTEYKETIDWNQNVTLESEEFVSITEYDALNRATSISTPHNANVPASEIMPAYDDGGLLKTVKARLRGAAQETAFVTGITYNPKGQREQIKYGNGASTKYEYDENNFRLTRLFTTRSNGTDALQDLNYIYDQMGNIAKITDNAQQTIFFNGTAVNPSQTFEYDALYRLTKATGREHINNGADTEPEENGYHNPHASMPNDATALRSYTRQWEYDQVGNILEMIHIANNNNGSWTRNYSYASNSNRLNSTTVGQNTVSYAYNQHGSMSSMPHLQNMDWDFMERLSHVTRGTTEAYYNYDGGGERVRKVVEKGNITEERLYLGGFEIYRKRNGNSLVLERETLHIMDDVKRIALVETLTVNNGTAANSITQRYQLSNNIESAALELDETASIISYEEYYPYGDTSYQAGRSASEVSQKRYRYTGKEKDEESGLYYMLARYYAGWLGRWTAADPAGLVDGVNLYAYCRGNPVILLDEDGKQALNEQEHSLGMTLANPLRPANQEVTPVNSITEKGTERLVVSGGHHNKTQAGKNKIAEISGKITSDVKETATLIYDRITSDKENFNWSNEDEEVVIKSNYFSAYKGQLVIKVSFLDRAGSFGIMFLPKDEPGPKTDKQKKEAVQIIKHERGHLDQMRELGLSVYLVGIGIPSIINGDVGSYYEQPWEITADIYGGVEREHAQEKIKEGEEYMERLKFTASILDIIPLLVSPIPLLVNPIPSRRGNEKKQLE